MLLFSGMVYMLMRFASASGPMRLRCLMLNLSGPVEFLLCLMPLGCGECYCGCL